MNKKTVNYYELLGLKPGFTEEDLDVHYREIINFLKPESHPEKTYSKEEIREVYAQLSSVNEAYDILKDPKLRKEYEESLKHPKKEEITIPIQREQPRKRRMDRRVENKTQNTRPVYVNPPKRVVENEPVSRRKVTAKRSFWENVKEAYREVKIEERKMSFQKRHQGISQAFDEEFADKVTSVPKEILFYTGKGTVHVFLEALYQLSRLTYINKDNVTKYVIRNRRLLAAAVAAGVLFSVGSCSKKEEAPIVRPITHIVVEEPTQEVPEEIPSEDPRLVLTRNYTIEKGDTLALLAYNSNSSIEELKRINGYDSDKIYYGRKMTIPYTINREDLEYYTESVKMNDFSLKEIARAYETDLETLYQLNPIAIFYQDGQYYPISNTILVPRFHTKQEVEELKTEQSRIIP
ncbi:MAG: LysM peptidoglycan-binding domain-containing protein [Bacilli bacterium]|nr:LysM peptidoglycan-binding domain-containing protein [Bacilli bacterium]